MKHNATHGAYVNVIEGKADIALEARAPSADELAAARAKGVELEVTPIALDAFVFLANVSNPIESVTLASIRGVSRHHGSRSESRWTTRRLRSTPTSASATPAARS
jgi:phosphate transport system substrate-binding protein